MMTPLTGSVQARAEPLRSPQLELAGYSLQICLAPDVAVTFVTLALSGTSGETVRVETRRGRARFAWAECAVERSRR